MIRFLYFGVCPLPVFWYFIYPWVRPFAINSLSMFRSSSVNVTMYLWFILHHPRIFYHISCSSATSISCLGEILGRYSSRNAVGAESAHPLVIRRRYPPKPVAKLSTLRTPFRYHGARASIHLQSAIRVSDYGHGRWYHWGQWLEQQIVPRPESPEKHSKAQPDKACPALAAENGIFFFHCPIRRSRL